MQYYREWCSSVKSRKGRMVTLEALETLLKLRDPGYASVYMFPDTAAKEIMDRGHSQGLKQYAVAADCLTLDIDSGDEGLEQALVALNMRKLRCQVWSSGGKGYHVVIHHRLIQSVHLPYSHRKAVEALGLAEVADLTLYQHGRLISLPGRIHPKTKKRKELRVSTDGFEIEFPIIEEPKPKFEFDIRNDLDLLAVGLMRFTDMINIPPTPGNRHTKLWGAAKDLADAGLAYETVLDIALRVNETWELQKTREEIELAVSQAFKMPTR